VHDCAAKTCSNQAHIWRIDRGRGSAAEYLGLIVAPDRDTAITGACEKFAVDPEHLVVRELPPERTFPVRRGGH